MEQKTDVIPSAYEGNEDFWNKIVENWNKSKLVRLFAWLHEKKHCPYCKYKYKGDIQKYDKDKGLFACLPVDLLVHIKVSHGYDIEIFAEFLT